VDFIENVSENLKNVDLHKDLDIYKALLMVFPEGKLVPKNIWQVYILISFQGWGVILIV
jgi:hypothetical protein